ncbi:MAG: hypothetical protein MHM6MM_002155 [Cercozoa sp. M6MM]
MRIENKKWVQAHFVDARMPEQSDFRLETSTIDTEVLTDGQVCFKTVFLSIDPYMRGMMNTGGSLYGPPRKIGDVMPAECVVQVAASKSDDWAVGDIAAGRFGWQTHAVVSPSELPHEFGLHKIVLPKGVPLEYAFGPLGMVGMTAWFGLTEICKPEAGKTLFVSSAAGAVGTLVVQIGKALGLRVFGSCSTSKVHRVLAAGADGCVDYFGKDEQALTEEIKGLCGDQGIDYYFDNTGGPVTGAVMANMNRHGIVSVCGQIHDYNAGADFYRTAKSPLIWAVVKSVRIEGFLVYQWASRFPEGIAAMSKLLREKKITMDFDIRDGIEHAPEMLMALLTSTRRAHGKTLVRCSEVDPTERPHLTNAQS